VADSVANPYEPVHIALLSPTIESRADAASRLAAGLRRRGHIGELNASIRRRVRVSLDLRDPLAEAGGEGALQRGVAERIRDLVELRLRLLGDHGRIENRNKPRHRWTAASPRSG